MLKIGTLSDWWKLLFWLIVKLSEAICVCILVRMMKGRRGGWRRFGEIAHPETKQTLRLWALCVVILFIWCCRIIKKWFVVSKTWVIFITTLSIPVLDSSVGLKNNSNKHIILHECWPMFDCSCAQQRSLESSSSHSLMGDTFTRAEAENHLWNVPWK